MVRTLDFHSKNVGSTPTTLIISCHLTLIWDSNSTFLYPNYKFSFIDILLFCFGSWLLNLPNLLLFSITTSLIVIILSITTLLVLEHINALDYLLTKSSTDNIFLYGLPPYSGKYRDDDFYNPKRSLGELPIWWIFPLSESQIKRKNPHFYYSLTSPIIILFWWIYLSVIIFFFFAIRLWSFIFFLVFHFICFNYKVLYKKSWHRPLKAVDIPRDTPLFFKSWLIHGYQIPSIEAFKVILSSYALLVNNKKVKPPFQKFISLFIMRQIIGFPVRLLWESKHLAMRNSWRGNLSYIKIAVNRTFFELLPDYVYWRKESILFKITEQRLFLDPFSLNNWYDDLTDPLFQDKYIELEDSADEISIFGSNLLIKRQGARVRLSAYYRDFVERSLQYVSSNSHSDPLDFNPTTDYTFGLFVHWDYEKDSVIYSSSFRPHLSVPSIFDTK